MNASVRNRSLRAVLLWAAVYLLVGLAFAAFASWSTTDPMRVTWSRLAWLISAVAFAGPIGYGHFRLGTSSRATATHASIAAAVGAFGLAVAANVHGWLVASSSQRSLGLALVAWPLLIGVPAFVVAMVAAAVLDRWCRRS